MNWRDSGVGTNSTSSNHASSLANNMSIMRSRDDSNFGVTGSHRPLDTPLLAIFAGRDRSIPITDVRAFRDSALTLD